MYRCGLEDDATTRGKWHIAMQLFRTKGMIIKV